MACVGVGRSWTRLQQTAGTLWTCGARGCSSTPPSSSGEGEGKSTRPSVLWSLKAEADDAQIQRLAGKIGLLCRDGEGLCVVGARGEASTAHALRAIAAASELGKSPVEFRVRWHEDPGEERSLRFYGEMRYPWTAFKSMWKGFGKEVNVRSVTPHTDVHRLATALAMEQRFRGAVALKLHYANSTVLSVAAKALATLPYVQQYEARGAAIVCVLRWDVRNPEAKFAYAHLFKRSHVEGEAEPRTAYMRRSPAGGGAEEASE